MSGSPIKYWLVLATILACVYGSFVVWRWRASQAPVGAPVAIAPPPALHAKPAEFTLTDQFGQPFDSASLKGKVWIGSFFFTNCPGSCWKLNQALAGIQMANPQTKTRFISITCDPANDTPEALAKYAEHFKADPARWTFLTGDMKEIKRIGNENFQVGVDTATHSDRAFLVDSSGMLRGTFLLTDPAHIDRLLRLLSVVEDEPVAADVGEAG